MLPKDNVKEETMEITLNNQAELEKAKCFFEDTSDLISVNSSELPLSSVEGNIYALYVDKKIKYIGERQSGKITERLNQHLHKCSSSTSSKLNKIENAFKNNQTVAYKTLTVFPEYERYSVETYLIQNIEDLEWNVRDTKRKVMEISPIESMEIDLQNDNDV